MYNTDSLGLHAGGVTELGCPWGWATLHGHLEDCLGLPEVDWQ